MDVGRAALDRVGQDQVHQPDDRRLFGGGLQLGEVDLLLVLQELEVLLVLLLREVVHDLLELEGMDGAVVPVDRLLDGDFAGDYRLHVVAGHELDVVHGEHVGRVHHGDGQGGAGAADRHDQIFLRHLARDELHDRVIDLDLREVDGGHAVLLGEDAGDVLFFDEPELDEVQAELAAVGLLIFQGLLELLRSEKPGLDQHLAQLDRHSGPHREFADGAPLSQSQILEYGVTNYVREQFMSSDSRKYAYKDLTPRP